METPNTVTHPTTTIDKANDLTPFASRDETRYVLNGIHFTPEYTEATDGRMLARLAYPANSTPPDSDFIIPTDDIKQAFKSSKSVDVTPNCTVATLVSGKSTVTAELIPQNYPNTKQVWPKDDSDVTLTIGLQASLVERIAHYCAGLSKDPVCITFQFRGDCGTVVWSAPLQDGRKVTGLLMPMRIK
jgi:DNA polymerase III sliding clamp (beta) subunit (PCNA family)